MDELEKHIRDNRAEMDIHDPEPGLWNRIEKQLQEEKSRDRKQPPGRGWHQGKLLWRAAAAVIIACGSLAVIFVGLRAHERMNDPYITEVQETHHYYDSQIRMLYEEAEPLLTANPDIRTELKAGMGELDSLSAQIIRDLHDNIASQEVVEALITNYRLRIELLEDMLQFMRKNEAGTEKITGNEL